jgi:4-oxalocrotonate tautomerase
MPFVSIKIAGPSLAPEQIQVLQQQVTDLMAGILRKKAELTAVLIEQAPIAGWSVGSHPVRVAAHLDAKITAGTNSEEEKARFIAEAADVLKKLLGADLPVATYVVVDEIPGDAWGYSGLTQDFRRKQAVSG